MCKNNQRIFIGEALCFLCHKTETYLRVVFGNKKLFPPSLEQTEIGTNACGQVQPSGKCGVKTRAARTHTYIKVAKLYTNIHTATRKVNETQGSIPQMRGFSKSVGLLKPKKGMQIFSR
jgi:hypothetical protein